MKVVINTSHGGYRLSKDAAKALRELNPSWKGVSYRDFSSFLPRHDERLIQVVELLGPQASGPFSTLTVVSIDSTKYFIHETEGRETVLTPDTIKWLGPEKSPTLQLLPE